MKKNNGVCGYCGKPLPPDSSPVRQYHPECAKLVHKASVLALTAEASQVHKSLKSKSRIKQPKKRAKARRCLFSECTTIIMSPYPGYCDKHREYVEKSPECYMPRMAKTHAASGTMRGE